MRTDPPPSPDSAPDSHGRQAEAGAPGAAAGAAASAGAAPPIARTQVAGVRDLAEAAMLAEAGVEWIGIPLRLPVNREDVTDAEAAAIVQAGARLGVSFVLITYLTQATDIALLAGRIGVRHIQVHGSIADRELRALRAGLPAAVLIKSLVVRQNNIETLRGDVDRFAELVDAFITDTFDPGTGASGATGLTHDWAVSRDLVRRSPRPVILAGGLTAANVGAAIAAVRPAGVDVHTGVENADGGKDPDKVRCFVAEAQAAFTRLGQAAPAGVRAGPRDLR